jgi:hypothetical protein
MAVEVDVISNYDRFVLHLSELSGLNVSLLPLKDLYIISLDFHRNQALEVCSVTASYSGRLPVASGSNPMTRGWYALGEHYSLFT